MTDILTEIALGYRAGRAGAGEQPEPGPERAHGRSRPAADTGDDRMAGDTGRDGMAGDTRRDGMAGDTGRDGMAGDTRSEGITGDRREQPEAAGLPPSPGDAGRPGLLARELQVHLAWGNLEGARAVVRELQSLLEGPRAPRD